MEDELQPAKAALELATESTEVALAILGRRLATYRVRRELTQAGLAREAGVSKRTVERIEAGQSSQLANFVRICRVLGLLEQLIPEPSRSPIQELEAKGKERQRGSSGRARSAKEDQPWSWGDDS